MTTTNQSIVYAVQTHQGNVLRKKVLGNSRILEPVRGGGGCMTTTKQTVILKKYIDMSRGFWISLYHQHTLQLQYLYKHAHIISAS